MEWTDYLALRNLHFTNVISAKMVKRLVKEKALPGYWYKKTFLVDLAKIKELDDKAEAENRWLPDVIREYAASDDFKANGYGMLVTSEWKHPELHGSPRKGIRRKAPDGSQTR